MNSPIRESIRTLATKFADELLELVRNGLSKELAAKDQPVVALPKGRGRRTRRSAKDLGAAADRILATLAKSAGGFRAEVLRARVGMSRPALLRPLRMLLASGRVRKTGQKRATVYLLGSSAAKGRAAAAATQAPGGQTEKRTTAKAARRAGRPKSSAKPNGKTRSSRTPLAKTPAAKKVPRVTKAAAASKAAATAKTRPAKKPATRKATAKKPAAKKSGKPEAAAKPTAPPVSVADTAAVKAAESR